MNTATLPLDSTAARPDSKAFTRYLPAIARILLGLPLVIFGLNAFMNFIPPPTAPMPEGAMQFIGGLVNSGYMIPLIGITHLFVGTLLVVNRWVPLALIVLAPFMVNSVAFHLYLERTGLPMALVFSGLLLFLAWKHRQAYRPLFESRSRPAL